MRSQCQNVRNSAAFRLRNRANLRSSAYVSASSCYQRCVGNISLYSAVFICFLPHNFFIIGDYRLVHIFVVADLYTILMDNTVILNVNIPSKKPMRVPPQNNGA
jgi:hypothetical protein